MYSLHENTKTRLCRVAFVVLCLVPTVAVLAWTVVVRTPEYRMAHQQALAARLGCQARIAKVSTPRPGTTLYEQVELWDADTREPLARLPYVEVRTLGTSVTVSLPYPGTINGARLDAFWQLARDQVREAADWRELHFEAQHLTLHSSAGDDQTLSDLDGQVLTDDDHSQLTMSFRRASGNAAAGRPAQLTITRQRQGSTPVCAYQFTTGDAPLDCSLLAPCWPAVVKLGKRCTFAGTVLASEHSGAWQAELKGRLAGVDLDLLMSGFPHKLSGEGLVQLDRVVVRLGRIESAVGRLSAGPGQFSRSLADAAQANLPLKATIDRVPGGSVLHYQRLNLAFEASPLGLSLRGETAPQRGAVLVDDQDRVLVQELAGRVPVVNLVRALVPQSAVQVPATLETDGLTHWLPVPPIVAPRGGEQPVLKARLIPVPLRR